MATTLSPEEQMMGSVGASGVEPSGRFNLVGALQDGYTPAQVAEYLATKKKFNLAGAKADGYTDEQILAHLMGETSFSAAMKNLIQEGGTSIKGIIGLGGGLDKERALAERTAAQIAAANNPIAGTVGSFTGAIVDPVGVPALLLPPVKGATILGTALKQGAVYGGIQGVASGFLEPVLTPEESRLRNTVVGGIFGVGLGGALGAGVGKLLSNQAAKAADADTSKVAIDDVAKTIDNPPSKQAAELQAQAVNYDVPAYLRKAEAEGTAVPTVREPLDPVQAKLVEDRIAKTEAEIAKHEADLANVQKQQPEKEVGDFLGLKNPTKRPTEKQVAALFKAPEGQDLPAKFGLVAPTPEAPAKQVAALFKSAAPSEVPVIKQQIVEAAKQGTAQQYLVRQIETKKAEVAQLRAAMSPAPREFPIQVETRQGALPQQVAARDARMQQVMERTGRAEPVMTEAPRAPMVQEAPRMADEAPVQGAPMPTPTEVPTAPSRGFQSGGAAATPKELLFAEDIPFETNAEKLLTGGQKRGANIAPISDDPELNDLMAKAVAVVGAKGRELRGKGKFGGSLEATRKAGEEAAARMEREEGSVEAYFLKRDAEGFPINVDRSWGREDIVAYAPIAANAMKGLSKNIDEVNRLRDAGELTPEALDTLTYKSQYFIGVLSIFQGKRTEASLALNAFKLAKSGFENNKTVKGFIQPGVDCQ
jgi:hypothetical protein